MATRLIKPEIITPAASSRENVPINSPDAKMWPAIACSTSRRESPSPARSKLASSAKQPEMIMMHASRRRARTLITVHAPAVETLLATSPDSWSCGNRRRQSTDARGQIEHYPMHVRSHRRMGSRTTSTNVFVLAGTPLQVSSGDLLSPEQVYAMGIGSLAVKLPLLIDRFEEPAKPPAEPSVGQTGRVLKTKDHDCRATFGPKPYGHEEFQEDHDAPISFPDTN